GAACTTGGAPVSTPRRVPGVDGADAIACGDGFACAHVPSGAILCWGRNDASQLGRDATCGSTPGAVLDAADAPFTRGAVMLRAAGRHACVLDLGAAAGTGGIHCWGANDATVDVRASADPAHVYTRAT